MLGATNFMREFEGDGAAGRDSSAVQAVVNIDGSVLFADNALIRLSAERPDSPYWEYVHGNYREQRAIWVAASPLLYVGPRSAPMLFIKSTTTQPSNLEIRQMGRSGHNSSRFVFRADSHRDIQARHPQEQRRVTFRLQRKFMRVHKWRKAVRKHQLCRNRRISVSGWKLVLEYCRQDWPFVCARLDAFKAFNNPVR